ncbi:hypothetical protein GW17_00037601 [Ensete ventricosum]|nr:hypothetical protein GW17_00037601 [Ensete ventricosum]
MCHTDLHYIKNDWGITMYPVASHPAVLLGWRDRSAVCLLTPSRLRHVLSYFSNADSTTCPAVTVGVDFGVPTWYVVHIPESLPLDKAAPLLCAGITVFSPMKQHNMLQPGKKLGVVGLGGLGHIAVKFGKAFGLHVTVISTSPSKETEAKTRLGADDFLVSTDPKRMQSPLVRRQACARSLDFIIDTVSAKHSLGPMLELLKIRGVLALVGAPDQPLELPSFPLIFGELTWKAQTKWWCASTFLLVMDWRCDVAGKRTVSGSIIGGIKETQEMMDVCGKYNITSEIELVTPDRINEALDRLARNDVRYRFVIDISPKSNF